MLAIYWGKDACNSWAGNTASPNFRAANAGAKPWTVGYLVIGKGFGNSHQVVCGSIRTGGDLMVSAHRNQEIVMNQKLKTRLEQAFKLTYDLVVHLDEESLGVDLPNLPSNRISGQLWCLVGARESYTRAIETGSWQGFSCSLTMPQVKQSVLAALQATQKRLDEIDFVNLTEAQVDLAFALLEHEVQHHGQLIRFVYGNGLAFPESWRKRYTV
jgi:hypothetical protein